MVPVDVDEIPKNSGKLKQPKAVGIAIGIGQYRETGLPRVKYAAQDAEVMAKYWSAVGGVPPDRIRRLIDSHALKTDVAEAFAVVVAVLTEDRLVAIDHGGVEGDRAVGDRDRARPSERRGVLPLQRPAAVGHAVEEGHEHQVGGNLVVVRGAQQRLAVHALISY